MSCCNSQAASNAAIITPVIAAGTSSPYFVQVNITQRLCSKTCAAQTPVFQPAFSLVGYSAVGTGQYVATVHVEGIISYIPCEGNSCCMKSQLLSQNFTIPFASASEPTSVVIASGVTVNAVSVPPCKNCGRTFVSETPLTLTVS